jgi:hypothetical protein
VVQGVERTDRDLLDARALVGHLVPEASMFEFLAEHRQELYPDEDLFPSDKGRGVDPGVDPGVGDGERAHAADVA